MKESDLIAITSSRSPKILVTFVLVLSAFTETNGFISANNGAILGTLKTLAQESKPTDIRELKLGGPIERELKQIQHREDVEDHVLAGGPDDVSHLRLRAAVRISSRSI